MTEYLDVVRAMVWWRDRPVRWGEYAAWVSGYLGLPEFQDVAFVRIKSKGSWARLPFDRGGFGSLLAEGQPPEWAFCHPEGSGDRFHPMTTAPMAFTNMLSDAAAESDAARMISIFAADGGASMAEIEYVGGEPGLEAVARAFKASVKHWRADGGAVTTLSLISALDTRAVGYLTYIRKAPAIESLPEGFVCEPDAEGVFIQPRGHLPVANDPVTLAGLKSLKRALEAKHLLDDS
ncbi:MAG: hypothetical protein QM767_02935 [Anaeromyxobacter sp.]